MTVIRSDYASSSIGVEPVVVPMATALGSGTPNPKFAQNTRHIQPQTWA